ncbi:MAG: dimethylamine monooxygenase subunit DmmA family protein [Gammaproteobacteria bacterium]
MLVTGIKSKPVYAPLQADIRGRYHLMLGMGVGAAPLLRVIAEMRAAAAPSLNNTRVLFVPAAAQSRGDGATHEAGAAPEVEHFKATAVGDVQSFAETPALLAQFRSILERSSMGTRLYVAGPESFIGLVMKIALEFNLNKDEIRAEECGSLARRIYCIHCRATTEEVRTNIVRCVGCERWLLVRDHYSRRLAAYMGVMVDAEAPGELPVLKEVFL